MGTSLDASGWRWGSDRWARTNQHRQDSARGFSDHLNAGRVFSAEKILAPLYAAHPQLINNFTDVNAAELAILAQERDPEIFFRGLIVLGARLESRDNPALAAELYALCAAQADPKLKAAAQVRLDALLGSGPWALRAEGFLKNFAATATDPCAILPMLAGTAVYRMVRAGSLFRLSAAPASFFTRGLGANVGAGLLGFAAEVPTFALGSRALHSLKGAALPWDFAALKGDLRDTAITLGALKLSAQAAKLVLASPQLPALTRASLPVAAQFAALWGAHRYTGQPAAFGDILGSLVSLSVGSHLGNRLMGPRYANFQLELQLHRETPRPNFPNLLPRKEFVPNFFTRGPSPLASNLALMDSKGVAGSPPNDKAAILGHYSRAARGLLENPEANLFPLWKALLGYAEQAKADDAARAYARLHSAFEKLSERKSSDINAWGCAACDLATSHYRAGHGAEAERFIAQALSEGLDWIDFRVLGILSKFKDGKPLDSFVASMRRQGISQWEELQAEINRENRELKSQYGPAKHSVEEWTAKSEFPELALDFGSANQYLEAWLSAPKLYRDGLSRLEVFPSGSQALELYRRAAIHMPREFSDAERKELAQRYLKLLRKQKTAYLSLTMRTTSLVPLEESFKDSRFYWRHALMIADIYLTSTEPETRRLGLDFILNELSRKTSEQAPIPFGSNVMLPELDIARPDPADRFLPALWRIDSILNRLKHFPGGERELLLREAFETLRQLKTRGENSLNRATLLSELATAAFRYGHNALAQEVIIAWDQGLEKQLERSLGKAKPGEPNPREFWTAFRSEARMLYDLVSALAKGEVGMEGFLSRLEMSDSGTRRRFSLEDYLLAMDYLGREEVRSKIADGDASLERFARQIVLRYAGEPPADRLRLWTPLLATLKNLPVSAATLDRIFLNLLQQANPSQSADSWNAYRPLAFLISDPAFPNSEAYLLQQISTSLRGERSSDPVRVLSQLDWVVARLR